MQPKSVGIGSLSSLQDFWAPLQPRKKKKKKKKTLRKLGLCTQKKAKSNKMKKNEGFVRHPTCEQGHFLSRPSSLLRFPFTFRRFLSLLPSCDICSSPRAMQPRIIKLQLQPRIMKVWMQPGIIKLQSQLE